MVKGKRSLIPAVITQSRTELVPGNVRVKSIAFKLRWSVYTVIKRVESSLTSKVEQEVYLLIAGGYRIQPESLLKMLKVFRGEDGLRPCDQEYNQVGKNLFKSKFDDVVEKVEQALVLVDKSSDSADYMMSMESAAQLVEAYGGHSEEILGEIVENLADVAKLLRIKSETPRVIVGVAIKVLVKKITDSSQGSTLPMTIEEMFSSRGKEVKNRGFRE